MFPMFFPKSIKIWLSGDVKIKTIGAFNKKVAIFHLYFSSYFLQKSEQKYLSKYFNGTKFIEIGSFL